jgi:hypothetical protein
MSGSERSNEQDFQEMLPGYLVLRLATAGEIV